MGKRFGVAALSSLFAPVAAAEAQWNDPKLIAGQVAFHTTVSFARSSFTMSLGRAIKEALKSGASREACPTRDTVSPAGTRSGPAGKALAQKGLLTTRRSADGLPVSIVRS
jgi:hypothetical protein